MTVDTKKLRELAEAATEPCTVGDHRRFSDAANPQAIIALIDELEKTKAQLAEANEALDFYNDVNHTADEGKRARQYLEKWKVGKAMSQDVKDEAYYKRRVDEISKVCYESIVKGTAMEENDHIKWRIAARVVTALFAFFYRPVFSAMAENATSPVGKGNRT